MRSSGNEPAVPRTTAPQLSGKALSGVKVFGATCLQWPRLKTLVTGRVMLADILRAPLKIALTFALRYDGDVNRHWGCIDGADGFFRSFGPLCELGRQEGPAGRN